MAEETAKRNIALVYGGHPSITRFLASLNTRLRTGTIFLYQSAWFRKHFPVDNRLVTDHITVTDSVNDDMNQSLSLMRKTMLSNHNFGLGLFMGGMGGLAEELELFHTLHPKALLWPLKKLGGQTATLFEHYIVDDSISQAEKEAVSPGGQIARVLESFIKPPPVRHPIKGVSEKVRSLDGGCCQSHAQNMTHTKTGVCVTCGRPI
ncbi:MAG: hypothetical protein H7839_06410 [Magnetococcus sp. YQC-5]